jgi:hypothetical protein
LIHDKSEKELTLLLLQPYVAGVLKKVENSTHEPVMRKTSPNSLMDAWIGSSSSNASIEIMLVITTVTLVANNNVRFKMHLLISNSQEQTRLPGV